MKVTKKELERIADICMLQFSEEEYRQLKKHLEDVLGGFEVVFSETGAERVEGLDTDMLRDTFHYAKNLNESNLSS